MTQESDERPVKNPTSSSVGVLEKRKDLKRLYFNIQRDLDEVENNLKIHSSSPQPLIAEISSYLFQKSGKRIRPALVLLCSKLLGYKGDEHIRLASLVEFIHTASLIHDDIIDNSSLRRGRDSIHARWGPNVSVLLGDYLYIKTIGLSLQSKYPQVIRILTDTSTKMIEGELTEYSMSGNLDLAEQDYLNIIGKKTASLFSAACRIGGILGQASPERESSLAAYGQNLGMTFQIIDDLLDFRGSEKNMGKPILCDLSEGRITLPLIYTLANDGNIDRRRLLPLLRKGKLEGESKSEILSLIQSNGALEYTYRKAKEYCLKSKETLIGFPPSTHRDALSMLSEFVLDRDR